MYKSSSIDVQKNKSGRLRSDKACYLFNLWILFYGLFLHSAQSIGQTVVTTYITKVQEERTDTRWTLTEWLRIKERMRMMDLWLAMFSEPKTAKFRPELSLTYLKTQSAFKGETLAETQGKNLRAQIWLTNLISSQLGIRTLNIDLGGEIERDEKVLQSGAKKDSRLQSQMGSLRIFGKHIQDSSLVLKYGEFRYEGFDPTGLQLGYSSSYQAPLYGAELSLYFSSWLGVSGQYQELGVEPSGSTQGFLQGSFKEAQVFLEISVLRLIGGAFERTWQNSDPLKKLGPEDVSTVQEAGVFTGLQMNL